MSSRKSCSDRRGPLVVIEGMPGAGKTSAIGLLERRGRQVVAEYVSDRPGVEDDEAHQRNWIAKTAVAIDLAREGPVFSDRDALTSLAFAFSIEDPGLLSRRIAWARTHLAAGNLVVADVYLVLDIDPRRSLTRRAGWLCPAHPWSRPLELGRLRRFYRSPVEELAMIDTDLGAAFERARWCLSSGMCPPEATAAIAERLAREVAPWAR